MIISLMNAKGGSGKSTLAMCLAHSQPFRKAFDGVALADADPQGSVHAWALTRDEAKRGKADDPVFGTIGSKEPSQDLMKLQRGAEAVVIDTPGESVADFMIQFCAAASDVIIVPIRDSDIDVQAFADHMLPMIDKFPRYRVAILPAFAHPRANAKKTVQMWREAMPDEVDVLPVVFHNRSTFQCFYRDGMTLKEHSDSVIRNRREFAQSKLAIRNINEVARGVLKYAKA